MSLPPHRVLSVIPPMTQLNTPYPSTAYLTGFLRSRGVHAVQVDLALGLILELLSRDGLRQVQAVLQALPITQHSPTVTNFDAQFERYLATITPAVAFLQGGDSTLAHRIASRQFLPEGPRFDSLAVYVDPDGGDPMAWAFGALGVQDRARHLATLYLNDIADVLRDAVDARFEFVRYAESLAQSQPSFDPLAAALAAPPNLVDDTLRRLTLAALALHQPNVVLVSVPFPGAVYAAFRIAQAIKAHDPALITVLGGGFVNTELRELSEARVFDHFDFVTLDAGERPLLALLDHLAGTLAAGLAAATRHRWGPTTGVAIAPRRRVATQVACRRAERRPGRWPVLACRGAGPAVACAATGRRCRPARRCHGAGPGPRRDGGHRAGAGG